MKSATVARAAPARRHRRRASTTGSSVASAAPIASTETASTIERAVSGTTKPKRCAMRRLEAARVIAATIAERHDERRVGALVVDMRRARTAIALGGDALARASRAAPRAASAASVAASSAAASSSSAPRPPRSRSVAQIGEAHAVGREHAGQRMDADALHAERVGDQAGMLAAGAAEAAERVAR